MSLKYFIALGFVVVCSVGCRTAKEDVPKTAIMNQPSIDSFYCYIDTILTVDNSTPRGTASTKIVFDKIEFFRAEAAQRAMIEDKILTDGNLPINDFYVRNNVKAFDFLLVDDSAVVFMQTFSYTDDGSFNTNQKISLNEFRGIFSFAYQRRFKYVPFVLITNNDKIIQISEQYIP